jgi:hypothetical protein
MLIVGDLVHFSFQASDPTIVSPFDLDPTAAASARVSISSQVTNNCSFVAADVPLASSRSHVRRT